MRRLKKIRTNQRRTKRGKNLSFLFDKKIDCAILRLLNILNQIRKETPGWQRLQSRRKSLLGTRSKFLRQKGERRTFLRSSRNFGKCSSLLWKTSRKTSDSPKPKLARAKSFFIFPKTRKISSTRSSRNFKGSISAEGKYIYNGPEPTGPFLLLFFDKFRLFAMIDLHISKC